MSTINETCHLIFPLSVIDCQAHYYVVRDVDVVGVGSLRRHQLQALIGREKQIILYTHEQKIPQSVYDIYQQELLRALHWLRPVEIRSSNHLDFQKEQQDLFLRLFPKTVEMLGFASGKVCDQYLQELDWTSWLLQDHWRYFVGYLRQKFPDNKTLLAVAQWEWTQAWLEIQPADSNLTETQIVFINPTFQAVNLEENNIWLNRAQGVYGFFYSERKAAVIEKRLDVFEAIMLDLLSEERKYNKRQLLEMLELSSGMVNQLSLQDWEKKFCLLVDEDVIRIGE